MRKATITRETRETEINIDLNLDLAAEKNKIVTGFGFADHMLDLMSHWAGMGLNITCQGDMEVDAHHSLEDIGICLGQAFAEAIGPRTGINRVGWSRIPMDESMAEAIVDISGRPFLVYQGDDLLPQTVAGQEKDIWREFFKSFAFNAKLNLHILFHYGTNSHHLLESAFKAVGMALRQAVVQSRSGILSTKGALD
ncbi:MAG: imidazoleglycerol-phosphate dehydratase HisB [Desulfonatronovibrio sp.]